MKKIIPFFLILSTAVLSCDQKSRSRAETVNEETINTVRNYTYTDPAGNRLLIHNSLPKSSLTYSDPAGGKYVYAVFWTRVINETRDPVELNIDLPVDSFEFPRSSGNYVKLLIPRDTMRPERASLPEYGVDVKSFLDTGIHMPGSLKRTIGPNDSTAFFVVTLSNGGTGGALRTGLSIQGQALVYRLSLFNNRTSELALLDSKEIACGRMHVQDLVPQQ